MYRPCVNSRTCLSRAAVVAWFPSCFEVFFPGFLPNQHLELSCDSWSYGACLKCLQLAARNDDCSRSFCAQLAEYHTRIARSIFTESLRVAFFICYWSGLGLCLILTWVYNSQMSVWFHFVFLSLSLILIIDSDCTAPNWYYQFVTNSGFQCSFFSGQVHSWNLHAKSFKHFINYLTWFIHVL